MLQINFTKRIEKIAVLAFGMWGRVFYWKCTDVSEELAASIIINLMM
jgi:hypothetical protein